jgi:hypothetical protein
MKGYLMKARDGINANFAGGLAICLLGVATAIIAWRYGIGTPARMGPGFLPFVLGLLLLFFGLAIAVLHGRSVAEFVEPIRLRPVICILGATISFAILVRWAGLIIASSAVVLIASAAEPSFRLGRSILLAAVLAAMMSILFVYLLGVPIPLVPA